MTDRFNGNINLGGSLTREQFKACCDLIEPLIEGSLEDDEDGQATFHECVTEDFADLVQYCEEQKIALLIQRDGKYEYGAMCEYLIAGKYQQFDTDSSGRIVVTIALLQEHSTSLVGDYIKSLEIPEFPAFSIKRSFTVYFSNGEHKELSFDGNVDDIDNKYLGNTFDVDGEWHIALCVHTHDLGYKYGLMVRNIESGSTGRIKSVRRETIKIDDDKSYEEIMLTLYSGDEYALADVWVYDLKGEWINTIGYRYEMVKR